MSRAVVCEWGDELRAKGARGGGKVGRHLALGQWQRSEVGKGDDSSEEGGGDILANPSFQVCSRWAALASDLAD